MEFLRRREQGTGAGLRSRGQEQVSGTGARLLRSASCSCYLPPAPIQSKSYRTELVVAGAGPGGSFSLKYRVISPNKCRCVPGPSEIEWERFGYGNTENCLFATTSALINASVPW